jgi:threonine aldolase
MKMSQLSPDLTTFTHINRKNWCKARCNLCTNSAGIIALETMVERLEEDHINARYLGEGLASIPGIQVALETVQTNMVYFDVEGLGLDSVSFIQELEKRLVKASLRPPTGVRMVTHRHISRENISYVLGVVEEIAKFRSVPQ